MIESEKGELMAMLKSLLSLPLMKAPSEISQDAARMYWAALEHRELVDIRLAINKHIQDPERGRFFPVPADISAQLPSESSLWLDPDEAWAMAPKDENSSSAMCNEIAGALGVARELIDSGDMVAARMAFKAAYKRLVEESKKECRKPKWWASLGHEPAGRHQAEVKAVEMNNLCLPPSERMALPEPEQAGFMSLEYLGEEAAKRTSDPDHAREQCKKLKEMLGGSDE